MKSFSDFLVEKDIASLLKMVNYTVDKDKTLNGTKFSLYDDNKKLISIFDDEKSLKKFLKKIL